MTPEQWAAEESAAWLDARLDQVVAELPMTPAQAERVAAILRARGQVWP